MFVEHMFDGDLGVVVSGKSCLTCADVLYPVIMQRTQSYAAGVVGQRTTEEWQTLLKYTGRLKYAPEHRQLVISTVVVS